MEMQALWIRLRMNGSPLSTFKDVVFTQDSIKARSALAHKAVDVVPADGPVPAGLTVALVDLGLTALPLKARMAVTIETPHIVHTRASIQARAYRGKKEGAEALNDQLFILNSLCFLFSFFKPDSTLFSPFNNPLQFVRIDI